MTIRILTREPISTDPADGYEWRVRYTIAHWVFIETYVKQLENQGYTYPDSLRIERTEPKPRKDEP